MSEVQKLPDDVRKTCIQLVRGYDRRCQEYKWKRLGLTSTSANNVITICDAEDPYNADKQIGVMMPSSHCASRTTEDIALRLQELEEDPETQRMRAVEHAISRVRTDIPQQIRKKLIAAIVLNCKSGKKYPPKVLDFEGISERQFYRERDKFIWDIAKYMRLC